MAKAEWGLKRLCPGCGARYYDMRKNPPVCPTCKTPFDPENLLRARRGRTADKKTAKPEENIDDIATASDGDNEDAIIEDAEELSDDPVEDVVDVAEEER